VIKSGISWKQPLDAAGRAGQILGQDVTQASSASRRVDRSVPPTKIGGDHGWWVQLLVAGRVVGDRLGGLGFVYAALGFSRVTW
jgi:hypothetical protein